MIGDRIYGEIAPMQVRLQAVTHLLGKIYCCLAKNNPRDLVFGIEHHKTSIIVPSDCSGGFDCLTGHDKIKI